jgi:hypothetical protein
MMFGPKLVAVDSIAFKCLEEQVAELKKTVESLRSKVDCKQGKELDFGWIPGCEPSAYCFHYDSDWKRKNRIRMDVDDVIKQIMRHLKLEAQYTEATPSVTELVKIK